jgi:hypothetical protein
MGRIGRVIARRSIGFDMDVRYFGRKAQDGVPYGFEPSLKRWRMGRLPGGRHLGRPGRAT